MQCADRLLGGVLVVCWALGGAACAPKKEAPPQPPASERQEAAAVPATNPSVQCALSAPAQVAAGQPVEVLFRLSNPSARPLFVLKWQTPLEGLRGNLFTVTRDGAEVPYQGPMLKRGDPSAQDYAQLAPGASVEARVNLGLTYDVAQPGRYRVAFRPELLDVVTDSAQVPHTRARFQAMPVQCPAVELLVTP
jgi:hypothetical protein